MCGLHGYFGIKSQTNHINVSQIRTKPCKKITEETSTDVIVLMYKILFDYCIQRFAFRVGILEGDDYQTQLRMKMKHDLNLNSQTNDIQKVIVQECMIRTKMVIFLRMFHGSYCTGKEIDGKHWDFIQRLCHMIDVLESIHSEL